jgi:hypothetical protein
MVAVFHMAINEPHPSNIKQKGMDRTKDAMVTMANRLVDVMLVPMGFVIAVLLDTARIANAKLDAMAHRKAVVLKDRSFKQAYPTPPMTGIKVR